MTLRILAFAFLVSLTSACSVAANHKASLEETQKVVASKNLTIAELQKQVALLTGILDAKESTIDSLKKTLDVYKQMLRRAQAGR